MAEFVVFRLDDLSIGLRASTIKQVIHAVEVTPLPRAPTIALGVIDVHGTMIPVVDLRKRLGLANREIALSDRFIIAQTSQRTLAVIADAVDGVFDYPDSRITETSKLLPGIEQIEGIVNPQSDIVFIHDLERFLSLDEATSLDQALSTQNTDVRGPHAP